MCGIAGIVDRHGKREIDRAALQQMTDALAHRGPDGEGFFVAPGVGLGHRRLAIIDIAGGAQPFHGQARGVLSFNGEIYNFDALKKDLSAHGVSFRTQSDTELLTEGLAREGADYITKLRGMYALSFWDETTGRLTLARDRLGERPLYYTETPDGFLLFASEITAILASGLISPSISREACADYFFYGFVPDPKTIYRDVFKLEPGRILTARAGEPLRIKRYWKPRFSPDTTMSFEDAREAMSAMLDDAVSAQMISDVPLGAFLSGGVDSAGVVASMALTNDAPTTCTVGFDDARNDERPYAREIAERYNTNHHEHTATLDAMALIDDVAAAYGEPFADTSALPTYIVSSLARQHVTVALSGDGGDEIFAGYRRYPMFLMEERIRALAPLAARRAVFGPAGAIYPKMDWAPRPLRFKTTFQALAQSTAEGYAAALAINVPMRVQRMLSPDFSRTLGDYHPQSVIIDAMNDADTNDPLLMAQHADLATWLPGRMLTKVDRASMAHSLEVRPPLLDHQLVEWAGGLPLRFKLDASGGKRILKAALEDRLGRPFLSRKKQGFGLPVTDWLRQKNANPLNRLKSSRAWRDAGVLNERTIDAMIKTHLHGAEDNAQELWTVIMFDAFLRQSYKTN